MRNPEHQHDYSRIDALLKRVDIPTLTNYLNGITSELCEGFQKLPLGNRSESMEQIRCLIDLNNAFKDIIVDEYRMKELMSNPENEAL